MSFGAWLKQCRRALNLTQKELAQRAGYSEITVRKMEADEYRPSRQAAELLAEVLDISPEDRANFVKFARGEPASGQPRLPAAAAANIGLPAIPSAAPARYLTNLPTRLAPLIGRERQAGEVRDVLLDKDVRLLVLAGPPGVGKTQLGMRVAMDLLGSFPDGVFAVALATVGDPALVALAIAKELGLDESSEVDVAADPSGRSPVAGLVAGIRDKEMLMLLDNFEQVVGASPILAELVSACPRLKIAVTSREALHLRSERVYWVPPLALPDLAQLPPVEALAGYAAIALFVERARAVKPAFALTEGNAAAVATICMRLDGLPLAIELVAARARLLAPGALMARLDSRLKLGTGGERDLPIRHQTLRDAIGWSYDLLDADEQALFRRLGVFSGGCALSAMEAVCNATADLGRDVLDLVESLLDKSLVRQEPPGEQVDEEVEPRFTMLETIREYTLERLEAGAAGGSDGEGEAQKIRDFHAEYYLALAEAADPQLTGAEQKLWLERLEREHDNLRAALGWAFEQGDAEMAGRLGGALWKFWEVHNHFKEGSRWLQHILEQFSNLPAALRAKLLNGAGVLALAQNDYAHATTMLQESLALQRDLADTLGVSSSLNNLGMIAVRQGDFEQAALLLGESLSISRELGDNRRVSTLLINLGAVYLYTKRFEEAEPALEESLALSRELGDNWAIALALGNLAEIARHLGQSGRARALYAEVAEQLRELGDKAGVAQCLVGLAQVELDEGNPKRAVGLLGAAEAIRSATGAAMSPTDTAEADSYATVAQEQLGAAAFAEAWAEGHAMSFEQALKYALE